MNAVPPPPRRGLPVPFGDEPTRQVDEGLLTALRNAPPAKPSPRPNARPTLIRAAQPDELLRPAPIEALGFDESEALDDADAARPGDGFPPRFLATPPPGDATLESIEGHEDPDDASRLASLEAVAAMERARNHGPSNEERTRAVNIRNDPSISDIDWDLD